MSFRARFWVARPLLGWAALLGAMSPTALCTSTKPINPDQSCARQEPDYRKNAEGYAKDLAAYSPLRNLPLLVVPGDQYVPVAGETEDLRTSTEVAMGEPLRVCVMNLHDWIYVQNKNPATLRLSIAGHTLSLLPSVGPSDQEYLTFILHLDTADSEDWKAWAAIVDAARHSRHKMVAITVTDSKEFFESSAYARIITTPKSWYWIAPLLVLLIAFLVYLAATTGLLRNTGSPEQTADSPFSLGLVQMAFWFCLSLAAYVYICLATEQVHVPMGSVLGLLGISSTTGLAAVFVDRQKNAASDKLAAESDVLAARTSSTAAAGITPGCAADDTLLRWQYRLAQVRAELARAPGEAGAATTQGFLNDILNDGDGISFHRFQIVVWTVVLGAVFVWSVYRNITMPEFDASLLTLMGVSSGTYVGFKFAEKPKTGDDPANGAKPGAATPAA
ncbi:MAG: hypothetical protein ABSG16_12305 [Candidatus Acidiferrum sp.]